MSLLFLLALARTSGRAQKPNIVFFLTDDQDQILGGSLPPHAPGGATPIPVAETQISHGGATFTNMFIHTPICCPSRSETTTGRYLHNLKTPGLCKHGYDGQTPSGEYCCMHIDEGRVHNHSFATRLSAAGYKVGIFGKYLNSYDTARQTKVPPGFDAWLVNGGGEYMNPTFHVNEAITEILPNIPTGWWTANESYGAYTTAVVGNVSSAWIEHTVKTNPGAPFFAQVAPKAAHEPFAPAPWYIDHWDAAWPAGAPRPPSYNVSADVRADKVAHVAAMDMLSLETASCIDRTFKDRWRTLMSVDDVIANTIATTKELGVFDNTYFMYTSDHGFQLGEMNLAMDKRNVYDFDVRIHLVVSGPGIKPGTVVPQLASNVDLTPTWWSMAGVEFGADDVDGKSLLPFLVQPPLTGAARARLPVSVEEAVVRTDAAAVAAGWRDSMFIEYYFVGMTPKCDQRHPIEEEDNNFIAIRMVDHPVYGDIMYAEYETNSDGSATWANPTHFEYYEMGSDPWQLKNAYTGMNVTTRGRLHTTVQSWLHCSGSSCP